MGSYNESYGIQYYTDSDVFDIEDMNENFRIIVNELIDLNDNMGDLANFNHGHNLSNMNITGLLPVKKGGTGATNSSQARVNLGLKGASVKDYTTSVEKDNPNLVTSGGAYNEIVKKQSKYCYVVAADNSDETLKACADFVVYNNGTLDFEKGGLQYVMNSVPAGSTVKLLSGSYYLRSGSVVINKPLKLTGSGHSTVIYSNNLNNSPVFKLGTDDIDSPTSNITIEDMYIAHRDSGYDGECNLIYASNINGLYLYRLGLNYNAAYNMPNSALIKGTEYLRNVHIHDCVVNANMTNNNTDRYCFNFSGIDTDREGEFCAYISNTSFLNGTEVSINLLSENMKDKIAVTGILGGYKMYVNKQEVVK